MASAKIPLGKTVAAMVAGVSTVCAGTYVARITDKSIPPDFKLSYSGGSRYDQSTFMGRYMKMFLACDPLLLIRTDASFRECAAELIRKKEEYAKNPSLVHTPEENERLWNLKRIVDSAMPYPENGEVVPQPFRMSGYVPFNGPVSVAMVASSSTTGLLFWAWVNQSQNALVNYFNRNPTSVMSQETMLKSYSTAVASALTVGFALSTIIKRRFSPEKAAKLLTLVAFPSSVLASSLNCYIVRSPEIDTGVPLLHPNTLENVFPEDMKSSAAARKGVLETTASRAILQLPVYFIPPALTLTVFAPFLAANPALAVPLTTYLLLVSFGFGLPFAIAVFPQYGDISADEVEEKFRGAINPDGTPINAFKYDKGL